MDEPKVEPVADPKPVGAAIVVEDDPIEVFPTDDAPEGEPTE